MNMSHAILCATVLLSGSTCAHAGSPGDIRQGPATAIDARDGDGPERIAARRQPASGKQHLVSTNGWSEMTLNDNAVYLQLTDYGMKQVVQPHDDHDEGFFDSMLKAVTLSGVKQLLNHSIALSLTDTRSALVRNGEVVFVTCQGKEVFNTIKLNDQVQKFPQKDAEDFVTNLNRLRVKLPACQG